MSSRTWTISLIAAVVALALLRYFGVEWMWAVVVGIVVFLLFAWFLQRKAAAEAAATAAAAAAYAASRTPEPVPVRPVPPVTPMAPTTAETPVLSGLAAADLGTGGATGSAGRPMGLPAPRAGGPSDLKRIRGVGPKLEAMLHGLGYYHFDQVAAWSASDVAWVDSNLEGFHGRASRDDWVGQAKILAAGGSTEFSERVDRGEVYDD